MTGSLKRWDGAVHVSVLALGGRGEISRTGGGLGSNGRNRRWQRIHADFRGWNVEDELLAHHRPAWLSA